MTTSNGNGHGFIDPKLSFSAILVAGAMLVSVSAYIVTVRDSAANNQDRMNMFQTTTNSQIDSLSHRMDSGFKDMEAQLAAQPNERDVNNLTRRVDADDSRFTADETRIGVVEQQTVKLGEDISNISRASALPLTSPSHR